MSATRRWFAPLAVGMACLLASVVGELVVRILNPPPRTQVVRPSDQRTLEVMDGVPLWRINDPEWRRIWAEDCLPEDEGRVVSFVGDSILQVTGGEPLDNFAYPLQELLGDAWCIHNVAQAGFIAEQKGALARRELAQHRPDVLVWEVWGERGHVVDLGGTYYGVGGYEVDEEGWPVWPVVPVPQALHRGLFRYSRLYEYAVLTLGVTQRFNPVLPQFEAILAAADAADATLLLLIMPELERPFGEPTVVVNEVQDGVRAWARERHVPLIDVGQAWAGQLDYREVRLDPCCHYNPAGHQALAELIAPTVRELALR